MHDNTAPKKHKPPPARPRGRKPINIVVPTARITMPAEFLERSRRHQIMLARLKYAARGWETFPAPFDGSKKSLKSEEQFGTKWGKTLDEKIIRKEFTVDKFRDQNIGIATGVESGIIVVECDTAEHGKNGAASLKKWERKNGKLPDTLEAMSPSGSRHRYFKHPGEGIKIKSFADIFGKDSGVDVRGDKGMVLAPPSTRPAKPATDDKPAKVGGIYRWLNDHDIAGAPQALLDLIIVKKEPEEKTQKAKPGNDRNYYQQYGAETRIDKAKVEFALKQIPLDVSYDVWMEIGAALGKELGDVEGRKLFEPWSMQSKDKYNPRTFAKKWKDFQAITRFTIGTVFHYADEYNPGWREEWRELQSQMPPDDDPADDAPRKQSKFQLIAIDDVKPVNAPFYLVDEIATAGPSLGAFVGKAKSGKSFAAADMFFHVAMNKEFLGRKVSGGGAVVYVTNEGIRGFDLRMVAMRQHYGVEGKGVPFFVVHTMPDMGAKPNDAKELVKAIQNALPNTMKAMAVVVDTLARAMNGKSDSDPIDMGCFISNCGIISQELQCTTCPVHHTPRGDDGRPRGSNQFDGALDFMVVVVKDEITGISTATVEMMKDGPEGMAWQFKVQPKELKSARFEDRAVGVAHGLGKASREPEGARSARSAHGPSLAPKQRRLYEVIIKAIFDQGVNIPQTKHVPKGTKAVTREQLKLALKNQGFFDKGMEENKIRARLSEGLNALAGKHVIGLTEEHVWTIIIE